MAIAHVVTQNERWVWLEILPASCGFCQHRHFCLSIAYFFKPTMKQRVRVTNPGHLRTGQQVTIVWLTQHMIESVLWLYLLPLLFSLVMAYAAQAFSTVELVQGVSTICGALLGWCVARIILSRRSDTLAKIQLRL